MPRPGTSRSPFCERPKCPRPTAQQPVPSHPAERSAVRRMSNSHTRPGRASQRRLNEGARPPKKEDILYDATHVGFQKEQTNLETKKQASG